MRLDALIAQGDAASVALVQGGRSVTYGELDTLVSRVAGGLAAAGVQAGDRVAVWSGKSIEAVAAMFAVTRAGAVLVPVNPVLRAPQVAHILGDSGARLLLTNAGRAETLKADGGAGEAAVLSFEADWERLAGAEPLTRLAAELAAILYTSGSTGRPKGVMLSHANMVIGAESVAGYLGLTRDDRVLAVLPLSFDAGFSQLTTAFRAGARAVLLDYLTPRDVARAVAKHGVTVVTAVPPLWLQVIDAEWPEEARASVRLLANTGGRMPLHVTRRLRTLFPEARLFLMYGLTEAFRSTYLDPSLIDARPESIGRAIPNAEILVVRADGSVTEDGEPGELVHVGPLVAQGYWQDAARTAERFRPAPEAATTGKVGVWSGDTVVRGADGLLTFVGRSDEMIKTSGNRLSPNEIEEAAYATGAVIEAAAFGIDDARLGQAILLVAAPAAGMSADEAEASLRGALAATVPAYMLPARIVWLASLDRSPNGKIDRAALKSAHAA